MPVPARCPVESTVIQELADFDVFWYDNQAITIFVRGGLTDDFGAACPAGQSRCDLRYLPYTSEAGGSPAAGAEAGIVLTPAPGGTVFNIQGNVGTIINADVVESLVLNTGDSPEDRARRDRQRAELIAAEILNVLQNVDARLLLVDTTLSPDFFGEELAAVRATVAPGAQDAFSTGYDQLLFATRLNGLRDAFTSTPLPDTASPALLSLAAESEVNPYDLFFFYRQLREMNSASRSLVLRLDALGEAVRDGQAEWVSYHQDGLALETQTLLNRANLAYTTALRIFGDLRSAYPDLPLVLDAFTMLKPTSLPTGDALRLAEDEHLRFALELVETRAFLAQEAERLLLVDLDAYTAVAAELTITETDNFEAVIEKAIKLRWLGRITESVAAFEYYGATFSPVDATAEQYAQVARQLTWQADTLGVVWGGAYLFAVEADQPAGLAGLQPGDVVIGLNEIDLTIGSGEDEDWLSPTRYLRELLASAGDEIAITYLRLQDDGSFARATVTMPYAGRLGIGYMPI